MSTLSSTSTIEQHEESPVSLYVIAGAGAAGSALARLLADSGEQVRLVTRRGSGPVHPRIERIAADATDTERLVEVTEGASVLFNCAVPAYDRWPAELPPLAESLLTTAERSGADYVVLGNIYAYGTSDDRICEDRPSAPISVKGRLRARAWDDALAAYEAGRVRVTEIRAADFIGAGAYSLFALMVAPLVLAGGPVAYPGDLDVAHSWAYPADAARTLLAAARDEQSWGRVWHVPVLSEAPLREVAGRLATLAGAPAPDLRSMTVEELAELGRADSVMAEVVEMRYLLDQPILLDTTVTEKALGVRASTLDEVLAEMAAAPPAAV